MKSVAFHNLGCKVNSYETEVMRQQFAKAGYEIKAFDEVADIYVINTCTVTNIADQKSRQMIHKAKKENPHAIVIAVGCYVQVNPERAQADESIDICVANNQKSKIVEIAEQYFEGTQNEICDIGAEKSFEDMNLEPFCQNGDEPLEGEHTRRYIKIQDGCNSFCSYCAIPFARGRVRSRRPGEIIKEITSLAEAGVKEVVLTGIEVDQYGADFADNSVNLISLVEELDKIPGFLRIRLSSLEPRIMTEENTKRLAACKKLCPHFHLSMQSGSDSVLKRMNRKYDTALFEKSVENLRKYFDDPAITTDVIVGFPGETEEEFEETRAFIDSISFYETHVFKYSRRKGTVADKMPGQLTDAVKSARSEVLRLLSEEKKQEFLRRRVGKESSIITQTVRMIDGKGYVEGLTPDYVIVQIPQEELEEEQWNNCEVNVCLNGQNLSEFLG